MTEIVPLAESLQIAKPPHKGVAPMAILEFFTFYIEAGPCPIIKHRCFYYHTIC